MTDAQYDVQAQRWISISDFLTAVFSKPIDRRSLEDQLRRVLREGGPATLAAGAVGDALQKDTTFLEFSELLSTKGLGLVLAWKKDGTPFVLGEPTPRGQFRLIQVGENGEIVEAYVKKRELKRMYQGGHAFDDRLALDVWEGGTKQDTNKRWFFTSVQPLIKAMRHLILAAFVGNTLAVGVSLFALQVWDRVIPANSMNSLIVLLLGVVVAIGFELVLRLQRASLIDQVGAHVDRSISGRVFHHMLGMKSDARPQNLGSLASQIREINQIREAISSSMLSAAIDVPFIIVFVGVIYLIGGLLVVPILCAIVLVIVFGLIAQIPLARLAQEGLEEAALRNGLIVESVLKLEDIKLQEAERTMQLRWNQAVESASRISIRQRRWRNFLTNSTQSIQQVTYVSVVALGAYYVIIGDATMGQVIACSILANRSIAPLTQVSNVMGALQGSIAAKKSIDSLMERKTDLPDKTHLRRMLAAPDYVLKNVRYDYPGSDRGALVVPRLQIPFGSKVGIIGRIGSGKSTFLRLLSGLVDPTQGTVLLDGTEIGSIYPSDLRRAVGFQSQSSSLLRGTIRDNLQIARPSASDEDMIRACETSGAISLIRSNPRGLDLVVNEAGEGLSGGQKQSLLLARVMLRDPRVVLLDEPTASMDDESELNFMRELADWGAEKTLILATHRIRALSVCERLIVINDGRIAKDGPKEEVLASLKTTGGRS